MALSKNSKILASDVTGAIKSITRSGTTFTYTTLGGSTGTFTQQDNNTTYSAGTGISISSNKITNTGVTSVNGKTGAVTVSTNGNLTAQAKSGWGSSSFTIPSGGTWSYVVIATTDDKYYNSGTFGNDKAGGSTITANGNFFYIAVRTA